MCFPIAFFILAFYCCMLLSTSVFVWFSFVGTVFFSRSCLILGQSVLLRCGLGRIGN